LIKYKFHSTSHLSNAGLHLAVFRVSGFGFRVSGFGFRDRVSHLSHDGQHLLLVELFIEQHQVRVLLQGPRGVATRDNRFEFAKDRVRAAALREA